MFLLQAFGRLAFIALAPAENSRLILNDANGFCMLFQVGAGFCSSEEGLRPVRRQLRSRKRFIFRFLC